MKGIDEGNSCYELTASCATGLECLLAEEVKKIGGQEIITSPGVVQWVGAIDSAYRCCLWSRIASRVFLNLWKFQVDSEESLYKKCVDLPWQEHLLEDTTFSVNCTLTGAPPIRHNHFASLRLKDSLVDYFRSQTGRRPSVKTDRPALQLHLHINTTEASISLDMSGESLHRRGYREESGLAPLKENLAAALVVLSGWDKNSETLLDPMCGSGTLLIEAALMFADSAPGLSRDYFGFLGWRKHNEELWQRLVEEAIERESVGEKKHWPQLLGYDCDIAAIRAARKNIKRAGLEQFIHVELGEIGKLSPPAKHGVVISNLPYGERLSEMKLVSPLYKGVGRILNKKFLDWRVGLFIGNPELTDSFNISFTNKYRLYNGPLQCRFLVGIIKDEKKELFSWYPQPIKEKIEDTQFANRLTKNLNRILKWAGKEKISSFRIYDRDLPEYNVSIDLYGKWIHIQEWASPQHMDPVITENRFKHVVSVVKEVLGVRSDRLFVKKRERKKGDRQYEKQGNKGKLYEVFEGEASFFVNFTDYIDTGLFLDHRPIRKMIYHWAQGKNFLNLFGYTGTASVQAALGGAKSTTTVDLSATYLDWATMNFALNGLCSANNKVFKADCTQWLGVCKEKYDLIFLDPPTFSNRKKEGLVFDIQRDHPLLIKSAMERLTDGGFLIFSTNFRRFCLSPELSSVFLIKDISKASLPLDFTRDKRIHRCWEIRNKQEVGSAD